MFRFKTGTPARIAGNTIDYSKMEEQFGDERVVPFSFSTDPESVQIQQKSCWLTYTNEKTHEIIRNNLDRSPLYSGMLEGTGPRYCPSIEDKVVRFADKKRHQVFIEPEGLYTNEMYIGGMSSSLPGRCNRMKCTILFRDWNMQRLLRTPMQLSMTASIHGAVSDAGIQKDQRPVQWQDSLTEAPDMKKQQHRG